MNSRLITKNKILQLICYIIISLCSWILLWRVCHGFDWSDEAYYSAVVYRIIQGDTLLNTSWEIHQFSGVILVPLYWIYIKIFGTTGIILFSRMVFLVVLTAEAVGLFYRFYQHNEIVFGLLASFLLMSFSCLYSLSYNTMMIEAYVMAILLLPTESKQQKVRKWRYLLSGLFSGIAIQAYPSTIIVLVVFVVCILVNEKNDKWRFLLCYSLGGIIVIISFCFILLANSSFVALAYNYKYLFMDPEHGGFHFKLLDHIIALKDLVGNRTLVFFLIADAFAVATWFIAGRIKIIIQGTTCFILFATFFYQWMIIRNGYSKSMIQFEIYLSIALCFPSLWLMNRCKWNNLILLYIGGVMGSVGVSISTNNGVAFYIYPYVFSSIATVLYIGKMLKKMETCKEGIKRIVRVLTSLLLLGIIVYAFISSLVFVYRDGELKTLNTRITSGPAKGIYTTKTRAEQYEETIQAINTYMPKEGNVLYTKLLPFGYLCSDARPATPRLWRTNLDYPLFEEYYRNNPDKLPDAIYIVNGSYGITNSGIVIGEYMQNYIDSTPHKTIEIDCATIIKFN